MAARPARPAEGELGRLRHRRDDGGLRRPRRSAWRGASPRGLRYRRGRPAGRADTSASSSATRRMPRTSPPCAFSASARPTSCASSPTTRAGWSRARSARPWPWRRGRRSWSARPATSTPAPSTGSTAIADLAAAHGAWMHVDGAFGLWARAVPELREQCRGVERANSWAVDGHKWLQIPYELRLRHRAPRRRAPPGDGHHRQLPDRGPARRPQPDAVRPGAVAPGPRFRGLGDAADPRPRGRRRDGAPALSPAPG